MTREEYEKIIDDYISSSKEEYENGTEKTKMLKRFKLQELKINELFFDGFLHEEMKGRLPLVTKIVDLIKEQELTYDQAYATLEQAYNVLKYESNFVKV